MSLINLIVRDFRCIKSAELAFDSKSTLIYGPNASGKTSLLEAIHMLSCGRSFRTNKREILVRLNAPRFEVIGRVLNGSAELTAGVAGSRDETQVRIAEKDVTGFGELAALLPIRVIDPEVHLLIEGGPAERRRFIDWGVFHVEPTFVTSWRRYQRSLKQRNAALKARSTKDVITSWDHELVEAGDIVTKLRQRYIQELRTYIDICVAQLLGHKIDVEYNHGWNQGISLSDGLLRSFQQDRRYGTTTIGPHRADLYFKIGALEIRSRMSRGQQKVLAAALLISQVMHRIARGDTKVGLLIDDPGAELDVDNFERLVTAASSLDCQLIVTALTDTAFNLGYFERLFHVEQGNFRAVL